MLAAIDDDRAHLLPWLPWAATQNRTVDECAATIERFVRSAADVEPSSGFPIGMFDRATGECVGGGGFHLLDAGTHAADVGYWIRGSRVRTGLCSEGVAGLLSWGLAAQAQGGWGFRRLTIHCAEHNLGSVGVARRLGLRRETFAPAARWVDGVGWDGTLGFGVLADEWDVEARRLRAR